MCFSFCIGTTFSKADYSIVAKDDNFKNANDQISADTEQARFIRQ